MKTTSIFKEAYIKLLKCENKMAFGEPFDCVGYKEKLIELCEDILREARK